MADVVVTVPKWFGFRYWVAEGDPPGTPESGTEWDFSTAGGRPAIEVGERVYVVHNGLLRGYAPLTRLEWNGSRGAFIRRGGAVAVTIAEAIRGFRGWRYRWWERDVEIPFPDYATREIVP